MYDWERAAARGDPPPFGIPPEEQLAFLAMRSLYRLFAAGKITKDEATAEKNEAIRICRRVADQREAWRKAADERSAMWRALEAPASDFFKTKDPEKAEEALKIVYGLR